MAVFVAQIYILSPTRKSGPLCFGVLPPPKQRTPGANGTNLETPGHARVRSTTYVTPRQLFGKKTSKPLHDRDRFSRGLVDPGSIEIAAGSRGRCGRFWPRCLTTQGAATRPTALAPGPQRPGRPHCWRNGWRNGWQVTAPPGLPAASPAELGRGALHPGSPTLVGGGVGSCNGRPGRRVGTTPLKLGVRIVFCVCPRPPNTFTPTGSPFTTS